jgi:hypothetical protein
MKQNITSTANYQRYVTRQVGPREVGGIYYCGYWADVYEVLDIQAEAPWQITVRTLGETRVRTHCTGWDYQRDRVVAEPGEAAVTAWADHAHSRQAGVGALLEQRHVLDEIAHPVTTAAFQQLAHTARTA